MKKRWSSPIVNILSVSETSGIVRCLGALDIEGINISECQHNPSEPLVIPDGVEDIKKYVYDSKWAFEHVFKCGDNSYENDTLVGSTKWYWKYFS